MIRLRQLREEKEITQSYVAKLWGVSPGSISQWENGTNEMDYNTLIRAAEFYDTSIDYILGRDNIDDELSHRELSIIKLFRDAPDVGKELIEDIAKFTERLK